ncbi:uncharacterized protein ACNS7B_008070 isoform 1-T1 [Menidia menidia]
MKRLYLIWLLHVSLQLQCDKREITAQVGGYFKIACKSHVHDARRQGLFVEVTDLRLDDSGVYWIGIDKIYADIMVSITVVITEVPPSKPRLWPLTSLADRQTCWGGAVTVRCDSEEGTGIHYAWHQPAPHQELQLHSSDLRLDCGTVRDGSYFCSASNDAGSSQSDAFSLQVLMPTDTSDCIYVVDIPGQPVYDCADRMSTAPARPLPMTTCKAAMTTHARVNETVREAFPNRTRTGLPLWYEALRWGAFASLLVTLYAVTKCTKTAPEPQNNNGKKFTGTFYSALCSNEVTLRTL